MADARPQNSYTPACPEPARRAWRPPRAARSTIPWLSKVKIGTTNKRASVPPPKRIDADELQRGCGMRGRHAVVLAP